MCSTSIYNIFITVTNIFNIKTRISNHSQIQNRLIEKNYIKMTGSYLKSSIFEKLFTNVIYLLRKLNVTS